MVLVDLNNYRLLFFYDVQSSCTKADRDYCLSVILYDLFFFFFQAEDGIRDLIVTGVQTCALPIYVLGSLVDAGAELILAGHIHQAAVSERREFEGSTGGERGVTVAIAPGLGQPRPHRRGEARGLHV